jgi:hypothetical protein
VDGGLGEHGVVLELGAAEGRAVTRDEDELGYGREGARQHRLREGAVGQQRTLSGAHSLEGALVSEGVLSRLDDKRKTPVETR